jgi:hypothetical protein
MEFAWISLDPHISFPLSSPSGRERLELGSGFAPLNRRSAELQLWVLLTGDETRTIGIVRSVSWEMRK